MFEDIVKRLFAEAEIDPAKHPELFRECVSIFDKQKAALIGELKEIKVQDASLIGVGD
jgi:hypothetical protein